MNEARRIYHNLHNKYYSTTVDKNTLEELLNEYESWVYVNGLIRDIEIQQITDNRYKIFTKKRK